MSVQMCPGPLGRLNTTPCTEILATTLRGRSCLELGSWLQGAQHGSKNLEKALVDGYQRDNEEVINVITESSP
jgi:hypothetical protein